MSQILPYLFFLSCPISMGLMMWFMMRGMQGGHKDESQNVDPRVAHLEREVEALRASRREKVEMN